MNPNSGVYSLIQPAHKRPHGDSDRAKCRGNKRCVADEPADKPPNSGA